MAEREAASPPGARKSARAKPARGGAARAAGGERPVRAWTEVGPAPVSGRREKPRNEGLTMVIDKGLGLLQTRDLLDVAGSYIDFIKLAFGTSAFYGRDLLREKVRLGQEHGVQVYPGGTFLQIARMRT